MGRFAHVARESSGGRRGGLSVTAQRGGCYAQPVRKEDLLAYARRDWAAVEERKRAHWAAERLTPEEALRLGDELRRHVAALQPDWPSSEERQSDLATHLRVAESLRRVHVARRC